MSLGKIIDDIRANQKIEEHNVIIKQFLGSLEEMIKTQIGYEYHDEQDARVKYENLTVPELLNMLSYMFST